MTRSLRFRLIDGLLIAMMALPILAMIVIKILTTPATEGITITGARIFFTIPMPLQDLPITEAQVNSWLVMISILGLCLFLTHGLSARHPTARQHLAEWIVTTVEGMTRENMGEYFIDFAAFVTAILALSGFSSLLSLFGVFPPTSDLNVVAGWSILVFLLITHYKMKCGPIRYLKSFAEPVAILTPFNIISEVATPVSMAFRHYGNVLSGTIISVLVATALQGLSRLLLGWLPGILGQIPFLQIGIPAVLSVYFDIFSGCLQAYIFAMLTMMYVSGGFPMEEYLARKATKDKKSKKTKKTNINHNKTEESTHA